MQLMQKKTRTPIGIDVAGRSIHAMQLMGEKGEWQVSAAAAIGRSRPGQPMDETEAGRLKSVLSRQGFKGEDIVLAVPPAQLLTNILDLPPRISGAPVDQIARTEVGRMYDRSPGSFEMSSWDLPTPARARKGSQTMVAACGHAEADAYLDIFEGRGLSVTAFEAEACALFRALSPLLSGSEGVSAVLQIGWDAGLLLLMQSGTVVYQRDLPEVGIGRLHSAMTGQLGLDVEMADYVLETVGFNPEESEWQVRADVVSKLAAHFMAAIEELRVSLSYAAHQYAGSGVERLLLVGEGASIPGLGEHMSGQLSVGVRPVRLADIATCPDEGLADPNATNMTKAVWLARFFSE